MRKQAVLAGLIAGIILTPALIALLYLGFVLVGLPFVPFDLFDWLTRNLPGDLITFGIDTMINALLALNISVADTAKTAEQLSAVLMVWGAGAVIGALFGLILALVRRAATPVAGLVVGVMVALPVVAVHLIIGQSEVAVVGRVVWLVGLLLLWGATLGWATSRLWQPVPEPTAVPVEPAETVPSAERLNRRQFIVRLAAGAATVTVLSGGVATVLSTSERRRLAAVSVPPSEIVNGHPVLPNAGDPVMPAPGTRPEYTPVEDHYKVFIRTQPTVIEESEWVLPIEGLVDNPQMLTLEQIRDNYPAREQFVTLSCISGRIWTSLISTTKWTGVSLQDILRDAGVQDSAHYLFITSGDGFYETVDLELINSDERIMLAYAWDDEPIPVDHGFPLRIWIPDRYGMKQPKWITHIDVTDSYTPGYWVERNWDKEARVKTTSVIDTVATDAVFAEGDQEYIPVGGIAFAGAKGISQVEVRVDDGPWEVAQLRTPLSETTWVIWRYDWPFSPGNHTLEVRCAEADGTPQIEEEQPTRPSGATGIHEVEATV